MVKKIRFQETRRRRRREEHGAFVFEPRDAAWIGAVITAAIMVQLLYLG